MEEIGLCIHDMAYNNSLIFGGDPTLSGVELDQAHRKNSRDVDRTVLVAR